MAEQSEVAGHPRSAPDTPGAAGAGGAEGRAAPAAQSGDHPAAAGLASPSDHRLAAELARRAGDLLVGLRGRLVEGGAPGWVLGAEGDRRAQDFLSRELDAARPADAVLSEEAEDDPARLGSERVWVIDPLDGTRQFCEPGRGDWAVHVALAVGERPAAGAVSLPVLGMVLSTLDPPRLPAARDGRLRVVVSRSRPPWQAIAVGAALDAEIVSLGSAGAKAMAVVTGHADVYVHAGGQYEWDSCAPAAVAAAAGCAVSRLDGAELRYNQPDPYLPDFVVCRPELAPAVLAAIARS